MDFSGDSVFLGAMLGSTQFMRVLLLFEVFHTFSTLWQTRILAAFLLIWFEWIRVPSRCFWMQFCSALFALGILDVFLELHVTPVMMAWIFRRIFMAFFGLLFGVEPVLPIHAPVG